MLLAAMLWVFGVLVHLTNSFVALPLFNRSQLVPAAAMALATFQTPIGPPRASDAGSTGDWLIATALIAVYFANSIETIHAKKDTQQASTGRGPMRRNGWSRCGAASRYDALTGALNRRAFDDVLAGCSSPATIATTATTARASRSGHRPRRVQAGERYLQPCRRRCRAGGGGAAAVGAGRAGRVWWRGWAGTNSW